MKKNDLADLTKRELEILDILGFQKGSKVAAVSFLRKKIKNMSPKDFHAKGIPFLVVKRILKKINPQDPILRIEKKRYIFDEKEINEMMNSVGSLG